jgi:enterochelin esterase-like enzyme
MRMRKLLEAICMTAMVAMQAACVSAGEPATTAAVASATIAPNAAAPTPATVVTVQLDAPAFAPDKVTVAIHLPPGYDATSATRYPVLYVNDGQDAAAVGLADTLAQLYDEEALDRVIVVAIRMLPDRMGTYGLSDRGGQRSIAGDSRFGPVGDRAHAYSEWVAKTLVPYVDATYRTNATPASRAVLGWSLGALNAFNLGWQYPDVFGTVGAFSPSFWLAADRSDATHVQHTRLAQRMVDAGPKRKGLRLWFAVGTTEETDDRDGDGVVDAIDDVRDLIHGYRDGGFAAEGLRQLGYSINLDYAGNASRNEDVAMLLLEGGQHNQASWRRMLPRFLTWAYGRPGPPLGVTATLETHEIFPSRHVDPRKVQVWLPPGYAQDANQRYPVVYMQDGQNLFDPRQSYGGVDWAVDETMTRLIAEGKVRPAIVVGIWNTPQRLAEYMPQKAVTGDKVRFLEGVPPLRRDQLRGDAYLRFLVGELKPFIDRRYRTLQGRDDTVVMGSSMGGLIALYALSEYPDVFGGAVGISTHWPAGEGIAIDWFARHLPDSRTHKVYFDYGTETLDASYAPYQRRMDAAMAAAGYRAGDTWMTREFVGAEHSEKSWRRRVQVPLRFLLGR